MYPKIIVVLLTLLLSISMTPAQANGNITWTPPTQDTKGFTQDVSVDRELRSTFWKSQVYLGNRKMIAIEFGTRSDGSDYAQFMAYFDEGFSHVGIEGNTCTSEISRDPTKDSILSCSTPIDLIFPTRSTVSVLRESQSAYSSRWSAFVSTNPSGRKVKVGTFDFSNPDASITSVIQYKYPTWITGCEVVSPSQTAIFWQPSSASGNFKFDNFYNNKCGYFQFIYPESKENVDGISVRISGDAERIDTYKYSINEILYPDAWSKAFAEGIKQAEKAGEIRFNAMKIELQSEIDQLSVRVNELVQTNLQITQKFTTTISCTKGSSSKKVSGLNPKCPAGWKLKK
jgi:hypothetical protein